MTAVAEPTKTKTKKGIPGFAQLQRIGRSLMLPIASLPAAALLLRLGQPDMLGADGVAGTFAWMQPVADVLGAAGNALFGNLPIIFALGVAVGYAKKADGTTGLAALIGYLVFSGVSDSLSPYVLGKAEEGGVQELIDYGVLGGIIIGLTAALLYQKYYRIKPPYLAFFGGRRFVPIVTAGAAVLIAVVGALIYPAFDWLINDTIGGFVTGSTILGAFIFGTLNRLLVPLGLHHLLNSLPWFQFGSYETADGTVANGDIFRFLAGDPTAGTFLTGFFPIMMFALPAAALAIIHTAKPKNRKVVAGIMGSAALVSFVTGVTEPLEFAFLYVAYPLYAIHAVLTGTSLALVNALGIRDGFGFSAGVIDYLLNFRIAELPLLLIPIGLGYAAIYYFLFRFVITRWNLRTPGREDDEPGAEDGPATTEAAPAAATEAAASGAGNGVTGADRLTESFSRAERERRLDDRDHAVTLTDADRPHALAGVPVSPGKGAGVVVTMPAPVPEPDAAPLPDGTPDAELDLAVTQVLAAVTAVQEDLTARAARAEGTAAEVLGVTAAMAADPALARDAVGRVRDHRTTPARAVWEAGSDVARRLEALGGLMGERARDVRDVRDRIVATLLGLPAPGVPDPGHPFVLVADDLAPADTAQLDPERVLAVVTRGGGPTSHTAILARSLGIPAVVAVQDAGSLTDGETVLVDGALGTVERDPSPDDVAAAGPGRRERRRFDGTGRTADGRRVELLANVASGEDAQAAAAAGAEGVGLFRTEFCFLGRTVEPTVDEQVAAYRAVLAPFAGRKVVVRTLDAGADKPLPFVTPDAEPNPALGVRGLRTSRRHPEVLDRQLATAIARAAAAEDAEVWVMAPMIATPDEADAFVALCAEHGIERSGVMIEVPSAALGARWALARATFASIGTNDLTQYTMAADREVSDLARLATAWQPTVLALVGAACSGAALNGRPIGVCGEAAADPALAPVLVGLGVTSLSMSPVALADVAAVLAATTSAQCEELAFLALAEPTADAARAVVRANLPVLEELGL